MMAVCLTAEKHHLCTFHATFTRNAMSVYLSMLSDYECGIYVFLETV
jgi:hypothetical protein